MMGNRSQFEAWGKSTAEDRRDQGRESGGRPLMSGFAIRNPYFIIVCCLMIAIVGTTVLVRMPVDLFPPINIPVVVVATFYSGMPPEQIETDITGPLRALLHAGQQYRSHRIALACRASA